MQSGLLNSNNGSQTDLGWSNSPFCAFGVFSLICFELSVPVQVIAGKDSSPK